MTWNYRVTRTRVPDGCVGGGEDMYEIREVYYDDDKAIVSWSQDPIAPFGESWREVAEDLVRMQRAVVLPVVDLTGEKPVEVRPGAHELTARTEESG